MPGVGSIVFGFGGVVGSDGLSFNELFLAGIENEADEVGCDVRFGEGRETHSRRFSEWLWSSHIGDAVTGRVSI